MTAETFNDWHQSGGGQAFRLAGKFLPFVQLIRSLTKHARVDWQRASYEPGPDGRVVVDTLEETEALSSLIGETVIPEIPEGPGGDSKPEEVIRHHQIVVDVDKPAWLVPSSTPGHSHLYVLIPGGVLQEEYFEWLDAGARIGLLEQGYVEACKSRGMTSVRAPWVKKGQERPQPVQPRQDAEVIRL